MSAPNGPSPRLSIVIPAADASALEETLVSVLENRPADCEIVAAVAVPYNDPWNIAEEVRFVQAPQGSGRVGCTNLGVAASKGDVIHVLAAGWRATEGWADAALAHFADPVVAAVVPLGVAAEDRTRIVAAGVRRTAGGRTDVIVPPRSLGRVDSFRPGSVPAPSAPMLEAGFWRADVLDNGQLSTACGEQLATADLSAAIACAGDCVVLEPACHVVCGPTAPASSAFLAGMYAERLFWRSLTAHAALPAALAHLAEICRHAVASAPLATLPMLAGRLLALAQFGSTRTRRRQLENLLSQAAARPRLEERSGTIRIDAGHGTVAAPRGTPEVAPSLRRSA